MTLAIAYLSVSAHQRTRAHQSSHLRAQASALRYATEGSPVASPPPPSRAELELRRRTVLDHAKERWNDEVLAAARWAQNTDWEAIRERLEDGAAQAWVRATGGTLADEAGAAASAVERRAADASAAVERGVRDAVVSLQVGGDITLGHAKDSAIATLREAGDFGRKAGERVADISKETSSRPISVAGERTADVTNAARGMVSQAVEKGKDVAAQVVSAVTLSKEKTEASVRENATSLSDVELALQQRYEPSGQAMTRTVEEALAERYRPREQRDPRVPKGV